MVRISLTVVPTVRSTTKAKRFNDRRQTAFTQLETLRIATLSNTGSVLPAMLGHNFKCDRCDFEFCSGWSHRAGGQLLVCPSCGSQYILGGGQSEWGPCEGETLRLFTGGLHAVIPTDISTAIHILPAPDDEEWDGVVRLDVDGLCCPQCSARETLTQEFDKDQRCPACREGKIKRHGSCIY